jgi:hypothetical protein
MAKVRNLKSPHRIRLRNLVLAILLLTSSVLGVNAVIAANNQTSEYLVAGRDLPAGSPIALTDSATAQVNLGITAGNYLSVGDLPSGGYLLGPVRKGQLIPKSMLASAVIDERVPLVVSSAMGLSSGLIAGASVDIWVTPIDDENLVGEPYALVLGAEVARLLEKTEMFNNSGPDVELWVPVEAVGPVLGAMSSGSKLSLVLRPTLADE